MFIFDVIFYQEMKRVKKERERKVPILVQNISLGR